MEIKKFKNFFIKDKKIEKTDNLSHLVEDSFIDLIDLGIRGEIHVVNLKPTNNMASLKRQSERQYANDDFLLPSKYTYLIMLGYRTSGINQSTKNLLEKTFDDCLAKLSRKIEKYNFKISVDRFHSLDVAVNAHGNFDFAASITLSRNKKSPN